MTITNKTTVTLYIEGTVPLLPNNSCKEPDTMLESLNIHSEIGSCIITTEYTKRSFRNFGKLVAEEGCEKNDNGRTDVIISSID